MKRILILTAILSILLCGANAQSHSVYGMTSHGGINDDGVIFSFDPVTNTNTTLFNFNGLNGSIPYGSLISSDGLLYGTTTFGGAFGYGVLFSYDPGKNVETVLVNFDSINTGSYPLSTLIQATNGKFYGTTYSGGQYDNGVLFSYDPDDSKYKVLLNFNKANGEYPVGKLIQASDGLLYGMTFTGGAYNDGTLFRYNIHTDKDTVLINFNGTNGSVPYGSLIEPTPGILYGMTFGGGMNNKGVIFKFNLMGCMQTTVLNFNGANGAYPMGSLLAGPDDMLYGLTYGGGDSNMGVTFSYDLNMGTEKVIFSFDGANGEEPYGSLAIDSTTNMIYGMTRWGGSNNEGILFSFAPGLDAENLLVNFGTIEGAYPESDLLIMGHTMPTALVPVVNSGNNALIYPNPSKGNVYISFSETTKHYVEINDITGNKISFIAITDNTSVLPTVNLASGVYILRIYDKDMQYVSSTKLILQ